MERKAQGQFKGWQQGTAYINGVDYPSYNPPRKQRKEHKLPALLATVKYGPFTLTPVYRTRWADDFARRVVFLGYLVTLDGWYWYTPIKALPDARAFAVARAAEYGAAIDTWVRAINADTQRAQAA